MSKHIYVYMEAITPLLQRRALHSTRLSWISHARHDCAQVPRLKPELTNYCLQRDLQRDLPSSGFAAEAQRTSPKATFSVDLSKRPPVGEKFSGGCVQEICPLTKGSDGFLMCEFSGGVVKRFEVPNLVLDTMSADKLEEKETKAAEKAAEKKAIKAAKAATKAAKKRVDKEKKQAEKEQKKTEKEKNTAAASAAAILKKPAAAAADAAPKVKASYNVLYYKNNSIGGRDIADRVAKGMSYTDAKTEGDRRARAA